MKTTLILIALLFSYSSFAQKLEANSFNELIKAIERSEFTYKETGKLYGFISTQSCLHVSEEIIIFKNYCFPVRKYPARGYTIITREWGIIELYEETLSADLLQRDIKIEEFPVYMAKYLQDPLPTYTLAEFNDIMSEVYPRYNPGCWSTNFSRYSETNEANCHAPGMTVEQFENWAAETQTIVNDEASWFALMDAVEAKLKR